jgi:hypothetical protein
MAFHNAGDIFAKTHRTDKVGTALRMADIVGPAPADIVEHGTLFNKMKTDIGIMCRVIAGTVPYCPTVGNDFCAASGTMQQVL